METIDNQLNSISISSIDSTDLQALDCNSRNMTTPDIDAICYDSESDHSDWVQFEFDLHDNHSDGYSSEMTDNIIQILSCTKQVRQSEVNSILAFMISNEEYYTNEKYIQMCQIGANVDNYEAIVYLAEHYYGIKDYKLSLEYGIKACLLENNSADLYNVAMLYLTGKGTPVDYYNAFYWFEKTIDRAIPDANYFYGYLLLNGQGCTKNESKAFIYIEKAALAEVSDAYYKYGLLLLTGLGCEKNETKGIEYLEKAAANKNLEALDKLVDYYEEVGQDEKVLELLHNVANLKDAGIGHKLGYIYQRGLFGVTSNYKLALEYYSPGIAAGDAMTMLNVAILYYDGDEYLSTDFELAVHYLSKSAEKNNPNAIFEMGCWYQDGIALSVNNELALKYYKEACDMKYVKAFFKLGKIYKEGSICEKDLQLAFHYFELGMQNECQSCTYEVGNAYEAGRGVDKDITKALEIYEKGAEKKYICCLNQLSYLYRHGLYFEVDHEKSIFYLQKSMELHSGRAWLFMGNNYQNGTGVVANDEKALECYMKSSELKDSAGTCQVGICYLHGIGTPKDIAQAVKYFTDSFEAGFKDAGLYLGIIYCDDDISTAEYKDDTKALKLLVPFAFKYPEADYLCGKIYLKSPANLNYEKAFLHLKNAANNEYADAFMLLANCYLNGYGIDMDIEKAMEYYQMASRRRIEGAQDEYSKLKHQYLTKKMELGCVDATLKCAMMYLMGDVVEKNIEKAIEILTQTALKGSADACFQLGILYDRGEYIPENNDLAKEWYRKAMLLGHQYASKIIETFNEDSELDCTICLSQLKSSGRILCCGHDEFHPDCLEAWMSTQNTCPICRTTIFI